MSEEASVNYKAKYILIDKRWKELPIQGLEKLLHKITVGTLIAGAELTLVTNRGDTVLELELRRDSYATRNIKNVIL